ncbi:UDP-glucuronate 4-epimerase [Pseudorhizobium tarimense]|uniref:UDP-glucuronate 4-epimerase n=1 Tax=Pseudorhizobium tarimense TaxID=1079109 RepID=A0ABV2H719_9HYPH|nr:NAD-dependent epimerase/dehydratase family protein [Pseudorhizobium tarimense]MCJ8519322.1 NAD-dependent epimerase/dehydratase family protein [Pseudorhizobium tarimense]
MRFLITGSSGFIGFHLAKRLIDDGHLVVGIDGMTDYYDVNLKRRRTAILKTSNGYRHHECMLEDKNGLAEAAQDCNPDVIVHLAGQAGVRYSLEHPETYISSNLVGTFNLLEVAREWKPKHLLIASSSSIYGANTEMPFSEAHKSDLPLTLYAATKKAMEEISHAYAHLWKLPTTCFRFFTVYGPWGRPDMALFKFVRAIERGEPIEVYGEGRMRRDFTYVDDLVESIVRLVDAVPGELPLEAEGVADSLSPVAPWRVVNIGGGQPVGLLPFIETIEGCLDKPALKQMLPMQKGDVESTFADPSLLKALTGYAPDTSIQVGVRNFVKWYRTYCERHPN